MARKKRCTLCGGKLLPSGICKECGWDSSKNDDGYRLNTHNEAGMKLHTGDCEDVLNRENPHKQILYRRESASEVGTDRAGKAGTVRSWTAKASAGGTRTQTEKRPADNARSQTKKMQSGDRRQQKTEQPVRKKHTFLKWLVVLFFALEILGTVFSDEFEEVRWFFSDLVSEIAESVENSGSWNEDSYDDDLEYGANYEESIFSGTDSDECPQREIWNEASEGYVSMELSQGYYTVGYEIPVGEYQLECLTDTAWISVYYPEDEEYYYDFVLLYSEEEQADYPDYMDGEVCPWYELSDVFTLEEGMILSVDSMSSGVWLTGEGEGMDSLKERKEQHLNNILLSQAEAWTVGEDGFEEGVYDLVVSGEGASAYVRIESENGYENYTGIILDENWEEFLHYPFMEGDSLTVTLYNEDTEVWLLPSW